MIICNEDVERWLKPCNFSLKKPLANTCDSKGEMFRIELDHIVNSLRIGHEVDWKWRASAFATARTTAGSRRA